MRRGSLHFPIVALATALVAIATIIQMYVDYEQSGARGLEAMSLKLRVAVILAGVLSLLAALLAIAAGSGGRR
ncbi:hypothetical protein PYJP_06090 [Pyrofollis japonicus]|nr:hypothetical protein PYJP_06090 [Pyrofollis japonicus]